MLVPQAATKPEFGIVRGTTENGGRCYVEPSQLVSLGDELQVLKEELQRTESIITHQLIQTIINVASVVDAGIHTVARLDVVFSKAAFGMSLKGTIPKVGTEGRICVYRFVHPVLASQNMNSVVPVDLRMYNDRKNRVLIISGPNGGGKSIAMKSFGLVCLLVKLALPIPLASSANAIATTPIVDFFDNVVIEMGDQQSVVEGESTFTARLQYLSSVIQRIFPPNPDESVIEQSATLGHSLVLLDELGGGTDPAAGGAIAQAILEKLLQSETCRIVATTHSPRLKALSYSNDDFECATVLLKRTEQSNYKLPTFQLEYGLIGDSYALGAASRAVPRLPDDVLSRAATLLSTSNDDGDDSSGELLRAMTDSLEKQIQAAEDSRHQAEETQREATEIRDALIALSKASERQLGNVEKRLEGVYSDLVKDESKSSLEVIGETLATLRAAKKKVKTEDELLREKGLKRIPDYYELKQGESVVILSPGDLEGVSGIIVADGSLRCQPWEVLVAPTWADPFFSDAPDSRTPQILDRQNIAIWDYDSVWDDDNRDVPLTSVRESKKSLAKLLSSISSVDSSSAKGTSETPKTTFTSSRQRKASAVKKRKKKD